MMNARFEDQFFGESVEPQEASQLILEKIKQKKSQRSQARSESRNNQQFLPVQGSKQKMRVENHSKQNDIDKYEEKEKSITTTKYCSDIDSSLQLSTNKNSFYSIRNINSEHIFECKKCMDGKAGKDCEVCGGDQIIGGNSNMAKFLQYLTNFKLGLQSSYQPKTPALIQKSQSRTPKATQKDKDPYFFYSAVRSTPINVSTPIQRTSIHNTGSFLNYERLVNQVKTKTTVHTNHRCDNCSVTPITGIRYHCDSPQCENDYDLCESCYKRVDHQHKLRQINGQEKLQKMKAYHQVIKRCLQTSELGNRNKNRQNIAKKYRTRIQYLQPQNSEAPKIFISSIH